MKNLQVSEFILKATHCPAGSQCRPIKTDPFPKQGTELKKNQAFSHGKTLTTLSQQTWIHNHVSISSAGIPFCHALISGRSWCWPNRKWDLGTRDWSYSLSQKKISDTALAFWECVKQIKHFENKKKCRDNVPCEKLVTTFGFSSGGTTCRMLQRQQWLVDLFDDEHYHNMLWQSLNSSTSSQ